MFKSVASRSASAYQRVSLETSVSPTNPQQMVHMLFDGLLLSLGMAQAAMARGDMEEKGALLFQSVRILNEGLNPSLDLEGGSAMATKLKSFYDYCANRLIYAQLTNDTAAAAAVTEVQGMVKSLSQTWKRATSEPTTAGV